MCSITIGAHKEDTHKSLIEILKDEPNLKKAKITTEDATVTISYKIPFFTSSNRKKFDEIIETVISDLKRNDFSTGGFLDGTNDSTLSIVEIGQKYYYLTDSEYKKKSEDLELKKKKILTKRKFYFRYFRCNWSCFDWNYSLYPCWNGWLLCMGNSCIFNCYVFYCI